MRARPQELFLADVFWWFIAESKRRDPNSAGTREALFERIADHYVERVLHTDVPEAYRDQLHQLWIRSVHIMDRGASATMRCPIAVPFHLLPPLTLLEGPPCHVRRLCGAVVFRMLVDCFPNSSFKFSEAYREHVDLTVKYWTTGVTPSEADRRRATAYTAAVSSTRPGSPGASSDRGVPSRQTELGRQSTIARLSTAGSVMSTTVLQSVGREGFNPHQRSPALADYLRRRGIHNIAVVDSLRSPRRLDNNMAKMRAGPDKVQIDK